MARSRLAVCIVVVAALASGCSAEPDETQPTSVGATTTVAPTTSAAATTVAAATTTAAPVTTAPPTLAEQFASALAGAPATVLGLPAPVGVRDSVARLSLLSGAPPEPAAMVAQVAWYGAGAGTLAELAQAQLNSPAYLSRRASLDDTGFVQALYEDVLGRTATEAELAPWQAQLAAGAPRATLAVTFTESPEAVARTATSPPAPPLARIVAGSSLGVSDSVLRLYVTLLQRLPTAEELVGDVARYRTGAPFAGVVARLLESAEYLARRPPGPDDAFVDGLYADVLARPADPEGRANHLAGLARGTSRAAVAEAVVQSGEAVARTGTAMPEAPPPPPPPPPPPAPAPRADAAPVGPSTGAPSGGVLALGDSVMLGAAGALRSAIPGIRVDAAVSRQLGAGATIARALRGSGQLPGSVVVHLGNNGNISSSGCDALMAALAGRRVVLVTVKVPRDYEAANNAVLRGCAARHGAGIVDWSSAARSASGLLARDGYHLNASGARLYAGLVAAAL